MRNVRAMYSQALGCMYADPAVRPAHHLHAREAEYTKVRRRYVVSGRSIGTLPTLCLTTTAATVVFTVSAQAAFAYQWKQSDIQR